MNSAWSSLKSDFSDQIKDLVKYNNIALPAVFLLYEAHLIKNVQRFLRRGNQTGLTEAPELWIKFVCFSNKHQKLFSHTFHCWLTAFKIGGDLSDFGKIYEAVVQEKITGYLTQEIATAFADRFVQSINSNELYVTVRFNKFNRGDKYVSGTEIDTIKISDGAQHHPRLCKTSCDADKNLLWSMHHDISRNSHYKILNDENHKRNFGFVVSDESESNIVSEDVCL